MMPLTLIAIALTTTTSPPALLEKGYYEDLDFLIRANGTFYDDKLQYDDGTAHWLT